MKSYEEALACVGQLTLGTVPVPDYCEGKAKEAFTLGDFNLAAAWWSAAISCSLSGDKQHYRDQWQVCRNFAMLPEVCYCVNNLNKCEVILLKRGEVGFWRSGTFADANSALEFVNEQNQKLECSVIQMEAMHIGSIFGFHVPGANPASKVLKGAVDAATNLH